MKTTFLTDKSGPEGQIFVIMSAGNLRDMWATRLRNEVYSEMKTGGVDLTTMPQRDTDFIESMLKIQAENKFPENVNYKVRALEDDALTPVAVFGEEAYVISEFELPCVEYEWSLVRVDPALVVTLEYVGCDGLLVNYTEVAGTIGTSYLFSASSDPKISDGSLSIVVEEPT
jgi:hypothetical protein